MYWFAELRLTEANGAPNRMQIWMVHLKQTSVVVANVGVTTVSDVVILHWEGHTWLRMRGCVIPWCSTEAIVMCGGATRLSTSELHLIMFYNCCDKIMK